MFSWFKRKQRYSARERAIFRFWDGQGWKGVDPLTVTSALLNDHDLDNDFKLALVKCPETQPTLMRIADKVRAAFRIPPFSEMDGKAIGLTNDELLSLLADFHTFLDDLKKKAGYSQISQSVMAQPS